MYQTTPNTVFFISGSAKIEIQSSAGSTIYLDLGAADNVKYTESMNFTDLEIGSMRPKRRAFKQEILIEADLHEYNLYNLSKIRFGYDTYTSSDKTLISGGFSSFVNFQTRITHTGPTSSQAIVFTVYESNLAESLKLNFVADNGIDNVKYPIRIRGILSTQTTGAMLYSIVDTRST